MYCNFSCTCFNKNIYLLFNPQRAVRQKWLFMPFNIMNLRIPGYGDGKNLTWEEFPLKTFVFSWEALFTRKTLAFSLRNDAFAGKTFGFSLINVAFTCKTFGFSSRNDAFVCKTFVFFGETLRSLAKLLHSLHSSANFSRQKHFSSHLIFFSFTKSL